MWDKNWRDEVWARLSAQPDSWDVLVIGGGITGAGILREAVRLGLKALLLEQRDFSWGTSSRSSKLVHGGFRYLKQGKLSLTRASVLEREHLLHEAPGLIDPLGFLMTIYKGDFPGRMTMRLGLSVYDLLALRWDHAHYSPEDFQMLAPHVTRRQLKCGFRYGDAQTDDSRLVLRILREAAASGAVVLNYAAVEDLLLEPAEVGQPPVVKGVRLRDKLDSRTLDIKARVVVNATGAWADMLRGKLGAPPRVRPLRGSHLIFSAWRLPAAQAITCWHPYDGRPVFVFPWEGVTLVGTTDVDHEQTLDSEPGISPEEVAYLMAAVESLFPSLGLSLEDVISTYAGVRPVIGSSQADPSKESRDHVVWNEHGLLTVTGGKLTTFRLIALDVLKLVRQRFPEMPQPSADTPVLDRVEPTMPEAAVLKIRQEYPRFSKAAWRRLLGRYGEEAAQVIEIAQPGELEQIPGTQAHWAELRWAARAEGVVHLEDLLLRRLRIGLLLSEGGKDLLPAVRVICQAELGWDDQRWQAEEAGYLSLWRSSYSLPAHQIVPNWHDLLKPEVTIRILRPAWRRKVVGVSTLAGISLLAASGISVILMRWLRRQKLHRF